MKKLLQLLVVSIMVLSFSNAAYAKFDNKKPETPPTGSNDFVAVTAVKDPEPEPEISANGWIYEVEAVGSKYTTSKEFIRYLTGSWAKADKYTWTTSQAVALSFTTSVTADLTSKVKAQFGLSASYTTTYSVGVSIPADSTKYSKLSYNMDLNKQYIKYKGTFIYCSAGVCFTQEDPDWTYTTYKEPTPNSYLVVNYQ